ncbi:MAG: hypothetical protein ACR2FO_02490 [Actinomycetota bacterium]
MAAKFLKSKPVLLIGGTALVRKAVNASKARRKRSRKGPAFAGLALAGATGGAVKYFTNSDRGPSRRRKVMKLVGKGEATDYSDSQNWSAIPDAPPSDA